MLFEVWKDGKIHFRTNDPACIPTEKEQKSLKKAGYKIKRRKSHAD